MKGTIHLVDRPIATFEIRREDGNRLCYFSIQNRFVEWSPGSSKPVQDHGKVTSAEDFVRIAAEFLEYRTVKGVWDRLADTRALLAGYQLWERNGPEGRMFQVTRDGAPSPEGISGYLSLDSLLAAKGIGGVISSPFPGATT